MMRSMSSAVSGLKAMQTAMDVIGNNIANVNTTGFKKSRVVFADTLYQAMRGASAPTDNTGGTNPMGIGLGAKVAAVQQIHTASAAHSSSSVTDMAIDGDGYFILQDSKGQTCYSRAGNFTFDTDGNLVNSDGFLVMGWVADAEGTLNTAVSNMRNIDISDFQSTAPYATTTVDFVSANLNSETTANDVGGGWATTDAPAEGTYYTMQKEYYDSLGNKTNIYYRFLKVDDGSGNITWSCDVSLDPTFAGTTAIATAGDTVSADTLRYEDITFDTDGNLDTAGTTSLSFILDNSAVGADPAQAITFDLTGITQYSAESDYNITQDGYTSGALTNISVGTDGIIRGTYDNGTTKNLVQVALAQFQNPSGLIQAGSNTFLSSVNSGDAQIGTPGSSGLGTIMPSSLENSNVDLSEEFTDMITTQRGFQANSRVITTSDSMLEELVNLKRS